MGRYGQETSRRRCPFGRVFVSSSSPCTVTETPPELPPKLSPAGFLSSISTERATLQGGRFGLRRAGGCAVRAGPSRLPSPTSRPRFRSRNWIIHGPGRAAVSPTEWADACCRKHACIACALRMQPCVAMGRASSSTPPPRVCALGRRLFRLWSRSSAQPAAQARSYSLGIPVRACPASSTGAHGRHPYSPGSTLRRRQGPQS